MQQLLSGLKAAGEPTRLRLLAVLSHNELTVSELTRILGQSQPRVSRHLRLLCEAGLLERSPEGSWVFYRIADRGAGAALARALVDLVPRDDPAHQRDLQSLAGIHAEHAAAAARYFDEVAARWDCFRGLYVGEPEVEKAMLEALGDDRVDDLLDLGTGTGRVLEVFADRIERGLGIDTSREMLAVARSNLERAGLAHCQVRRGDVSRLELPAGSADVATFHHVLHFLDDPGAAVAEAARTLRPRGLLVVVDFAPHGHEALRTQHAHRRLGFPDEEVASWCRAAGLGEFSARSLEAPGRAGEDTLTVNVWTARQSPAAPSHHRLEVA